MKMEISRHKVGDLRPSQILFSFGIGSLVDLPNLSVMVMGADDWDIGHMSSISEDRLLAAVKSELGFQVERQAVLSSGDSHQNSISALDQPVTVDCFSHQASNLFFPVGHFLPSVVRRKS